MREPRCALVILRDSEDGGEILGIANMRNEMKPSGMKFATTKTMSEMRWNLAARFRRFRMTRRYLSAFRWCRAGNSAHEISLSQVVS